MRRVLLARYWSYWLDFSVSRAKLAWFRVAFFAAVGIDGFLQISHAPRYGAGDFNVAHFAWLEAIVPAPGRAAMLILFLLTAYLALTIAVAPGRIKIWLLTAVYGYTYFISQLNSYQHHYLVFLLLLISCFVPWSSQDKGAPKDSAEHDASSGASGGASPGPSGDDRARSWALRLLAVQIAVLYAWAALAKLDPLWLDGTTLGKQIGAASGRAGLIIDAVQWLGPARASQMIVAVELLLALGWLILRGRALMLALGLSLHIGIEVAGFEIGIFSYFMFAIYLLLVPERVFQVAGRWLARPAAMVAAASRRLRGIRAWVAVGVSLVGGCIVLIELPFDEMSTVVVLATLIAAFGAGSMLVRGRYKTALRVAASHIAAAAIIALCHLSTEQAHDYYKFWGGTSRRLANSDDAKVAYTKLTALSPDFASGHFHLANIARKEGRVSDALAGYERAQKANPDDYRGFLQAAIIHHRAGRGAQAKAAAERVLALSPKSKRDVQTAESIRRRWSAVPAQ